MYLNWYIMSNYHETLTRHTERKKQPHNLREQQASEPDIAEMFELPD